MEQLNEATRLQFLRTLKGWLRCMKNTGEVWDPEIFSDIMIESFPPTAQQIVSLEVFGLSVRKRHTHE